MPKKNLLNVAVALFLLMLVLSWFFHGSGVVHNDLKRNIYIPETLTMPLQVKAAYNGDKMFFRYRWPVKQPHIYHDMMKFQGGKWERYGKSVAGPQPQGIYEDRMTMLVDDGSVPEFEKYGGYITIGDRMRFFTNEAKKEEVEAHPYLGKQKKQVEVGKHLPETRANVADWTSVVPGAVEGATPGRLFPRSVALARAPLESDRQVRRPGGRRGALRRRGQGSVLRQLGQGQEAAQAHVRCRQGR